MLVESWKNRVNEEAKQSESSQLICYEDYENERKINKTILTFNLICYCICCIQILENMYPTRCICRLSNLHIHPFHTLYVLLSASGTIRYLPTCILLFLVPAPGLRLVDTPPCLHIVCAPTQDDVQRNLQ